MYGFVVPAFDGEFPYLAQFESRHQGIVERFNRRFVFSVSIADKYLGRGRHIVAHEYDLVGFHVEIGHGTAQRNQRRRLHAEGKSPYIQTAKFISREVNALRVGCPAQWRIDISIPVADQRGFAGFAMYQCELEIVVHRTPHILRQHGNRRAVRRIGRGVMRERRVGRQCAQLASLYLQFGDVMLLIATRVDIGVVAKRNVLSVG